VREVGVAIPNLVFLGLTISEICLLIRTDRQTDGHGYIDSASDADQEYVSFMGSATPSSASFAHFLYHKLNIPI